MANPQKEEGYSAIANELLEAVYRTNFNATELKIIMFLIRFTYGFRRKECELSLSFVSNGIGISKRYVSSSISKLISDKVLIVVRNHTDTQSRVIKINKDFDKWENRTRSQRVNYPSTGDQSINTTDEQSFLLTDEQSFYQEKQYKNKTIKQIPPGFSEEELKKNFEIIYSIYPKKVGKQTAYVSYKKWVVGKKIDGKSVKLTNKQIYDAVYGYVKSKKEAGSELQYYKDFSTLMGKQLLDYLIEEEKESDD